MLLRIRGEFKRKECEKKGTIDLYFTAFRANAIQTEVITSHKKNVEIDWTW